MTNSIALYGTVHQYLRDLLILHEPKCYLHSALDNRIPVVPQTSIALRALLVLTKPDLYCRTIYLKNTHVKHTGAIQNQDEIIYAPCVLQYMLNCY